MQVGNAPDTPNAGRFFLLFRVYGLKVTLTFAQGLYGLPIGVIGGGGVGIGVATGGIGIGGGGRYGLKLK